MRLYRNSTSLECPGELRSYQATEVFTNFIRCIHCNIVGLDYLYQVNAIHYTIIDHKAMFSYLSLEHHSVREELNDYEDKQHQQVLLATAWPSCVGLRSSSYSRRLSCSSPNKMVSI